MMRGALLLVLLTVVSLGHCAYGQNSENLVAAPPLAATALRLRDPASPVESSSSVINVGVYGQFGPAVIR